jgi:hypothetical protein
VSETLHGLEQQLATVQGNRNHLAVLENAAAATQLAVRYIFYIEIVLCCVVLHYIKLSVNSLHCTAMALLYLSIYLSVYVLRQYVSMYEYNVCMLGDNATTSQLENLQKCLPQVTCGLLCNSPAIFA